MRIKYLGLAAILLLPQASQACSCVHRGEAAGFIHGALKSLPSNARGAIFLAPGTLLKPDAFEITSDREQGALAVELSYPQAGGEGAAGVNPATLLRVGVKGGFRPGASYTIRYTGPVQRWAHPSSVSFLVDSQPLGTSGPYALVLDGAPTRQMLPLPASASCSALEAATVQNFHYEMPASHRPYADAVMFFSESRQESVAASSAGQYAPVVYASSLCERDRFGKTARPDAHDLVPVQCAVRNGRFSLRGWAGLLEVEDRLQATGVATVDIGAAEGGSCTAFGILKHALQGNDAKRIKQAVCAVGRGYQTQYSRLDAADLPPLASLLALARSDDTDIQHCSLGAMSKLMLEEHRELGELVPGFAGVLESALLSFDAAKVDLAIEQLLTLQRMLRGSAADSPAVLRREALKLALLPAMRQALVRGQGKRIPDLSRLLAAMGPQAASAVPAL